MHKHRFIQKAVDGDTGHGGVRIHSVCPCGARRCIDTGASDEQGRRTRDVTIEEVSHGRQYWLSR